MSGGSYDYLSCKDPIEDSEEVDQQLKSMEDDLRNEGYHAIADELFKYRLTIETTQHRLTIMHKRLERLMHDWEWYRSGDIGKKDFDETVAKWWAKETT